MRRVDLLHNIQHTHGHCKSEKAVIKYSVNSFQEPDPYCLLCATRRQGVISLQYVKTSLKKISIKFSFTLSNKTQLL